MIRQAEKEDSRVLAEMAVCMWDSHTAAELEMEFARTIEEGREVFFIQYQDQTPVGFAQCSMRSDYVEGTESSPVGYLEGIFVKEDHRGKGYAGECLDYARQIAEKENCYKMMLLTGSKDPETFHFYEKAGYNSSDKTAFIQWLGMEEP